MLERQQEWTLLIRRAGFKNNLDFCEYTGRNLNVFRNYTIMRNLAPDFDEIESQIKAGKLRHFHLEG